MKRPMRPARVDDLVRWLLVIALLAWSPWSRAEFDHGHRAWNALLERHVAVAGHGNASTVRDGTLNDARAPD